MNKDLLQSIGNRIKKIRELKGLTQANLAEELNMTASAFSKIELGKNNTPVKRLYQIAEVLEVEITEFFEEKSAASDFEKMQFVTKHEHEALKTIVEVLVKEIRELIPGKKTVAKTYKSKIRRPS